jgi:CheY-like chemotaxis protein
MGERGIQAWGGRVLRRLRRRLGGRELRQAEAEARLAEARLREALDVLPEGIVFLDAEGRYILWNQAYADIYHRTADLFVPGRRLAETLRVGVERGDYPDAVGREADWLADRLAKLANPANSRHEQRISDGRWLMIEERRTSDGGLIGLRVDITEMKRQSEALEHALAHAEAAQRAKNEFLADMSHELRTPLNGVVGLLHALEASRLSKAQRALTEEALGAARGLDRLVNGLLDYGDADLAPDAHPRPAGPAGALQVLVADDNPTNRKVLELMLGAAGMQLTAVENGEAALEAWRGRAFDLILMDLRMPVMDGLQAIAAIRAEETARGGPRAPIIVLSANTSGDDRDASAAAGADAHIAKPIRAEELFGTMEAVLDA